MSSHNVIVVSAAPKGHFIEGFMPEAVGAFKPGQCVSIDASLPLIDGRPQYKLWADAADGERSEVVVVRENELLGKLVTDSYLNGTGDGGERFFGYIPLPGDEVQVLYKNETGTADDVALGGKLIIDGGTGKVMKTASTPEMEPWVALEALVDPTADTLLLCRFTGH